MISWIQHHLIRHGRWIFLTLLAVVIVAFVFTIGNTPGCAPNRSGYEERNFYGYDLNSPRVQETIADKVSLSHLLNTGRPLRDDRRFQSQVTQRIALLHLADAIGVPGPEEAALADYVRTKRAFLGADGNFDPDAYTRMVDRIESNPSLPDGLVVNVLEEDFRIDRVRDALGGPGYLLPAEAEAQTRRNQTTFDLATATLAFSDFSPDIEVTEEALREHYRANRESYRIPERVNASYVFFPAENHTDDVREPETSDLRSHFIENRQRFVEAHKERTPESAPENADDAATGDTPDAPNGDTGEDNGNGKPSVTFDDVRDLVKADYVEQRARRLANEAAEAFAYTLYDEEIELDSARFNELVNNSGARRSRIEPYTREGADQRALPAEMLRSAFSLGGDRYYSDAFGMDGGFAVLLREGTIPSEIPAFETVREAVRADYRAQRKRELFTERAEALRAKLRETLGGDTAFAEAAESLGLHPRDFEPFEAANPPRQLPRPALEQARGMDDGELSPVLKQGNDALLVYVREKTVPTIAPDDEALANARDYLSRIGSMLGANALVRELVARGMPDAGANGGN